jgi:Ankyrin repeats (many copies)
MTLVLRADAPSFVPDTNLITTETQKNRTFAGASSSSPTGNKQPKLRPQQQRKHKSRSNSKDQQLQQQQQRHDPAHSRYLHPGSKVNVLRATPPESHDPKEVVRKSSNSRRRRRKCHAAPQQILQQESTPQQQPPPPPPPPSSSPEVKNSGDGCRQQRVKVQYHDHPHQNRKSFNNIQRRRQNHHQQRQQQQQQQQQHHHHHHSNNDSDSNECCTIEKMKELDEKKKKEKEEEEHRNMRNSQQTTNLPCMRQSQEEEEEEKAFPVLTRASCSSYRGDNLEGLLSSSSSYTEEGGVWKNAHEALEWTLPPPPPPQEAVENSTAATTCATIDDRLLLLRNHHSSGAQNHNRRLLGTTGGSSSLSSSELAILPRLRRRPQTLQKVSTPTCHPGKTLESNKHDNAKKHHVQPQQQQSLTSIYRRNESNQHESQLQPYSKSSSSSWNMEKLRNRWWELLREKEAVQQPTTPPPLAKNTKDSCCDNDYDDDLVSSIESFEDVYFGKGAQQQQQRQNHHHHHQQQEPQQIQQGRKLEMDDSYYVSALPLHEAIRRNDEACLRGLLKADAFPNKKSSIDNHKIGDESCSSGEVLSPLQLAVQLDRPRMVRILFAQSTYSDKSNSDLLLSSLNRQGRDGYVKPAILMAAELGHEECLQAFLSASHGPSILLTRDLDGNTVLHYCCQTENATVSMLRMCLRAAAGCSYNSNHVNASSSSSSSFLAKLLLYKNSQGQTCMHIACEHSRVDLVEVILSDTTGSLTLLSRVLSVLDDRQQTPLLAAVAAGCTDVVMALLMWRGNNVTYSANNGGGGMPVPSLSSSCPCPLTLAVQSHNVDMILLLLEFNDPNAGKRGYNLNRALHEAVHMFKKTSQATTAATTSPTRLPQRRFSQRDNGRNAEHNDFDNKGVLLEIVRILINAGANPCCSTSLVDSADSNHIVSTSSNAVCMVAELGEPEMLSVLLSSYQTNLDDIRQTRRRDPILQKQPESFFAALESRENAERITCMRDALAISLFSGWQMESSSTSTNNCNNGGDVFFECSLALYRAGADLGRPGLERIKQTFALSGRNSKCIKPMTTIMLPSNMGKTLYEVKYCHLLGSGDSKGKNKKPGSGDKPVVIDDNTEAHQFWSMMMQKSPWKVSAGQDCVCDWIPQMDEVAGRSEVHSPPGDIRLVCNDGEELIVHSTIISKKSDKLAAAIHFEYMKFSMAHDDDDRPLCNNNMPEIEMSACNGSLGRLLLQHIYHGSIADRFPDHDDPVECCHALLELMLVAGEYLCWSLVQECEMRLLAADSRSCHCCLCSRAATAATDGSCSNKDEIECEYYSAGPSMCITPDTALDVLTVCQYMGQSLVGDTSYTLRRSEESTLPSWLGVGLASSKWVVKKPLEALKEAAIGTILMNFQAVMATDAFRSQEFVLNEDPASHGNQQEDAVRVDLLMERQRGRILLQNTMNELVELVVAAK